MHSCSVHSSGITRPCCNIRETYKFKTVMPGSIHENNVVQRMATDVNDFINDPVIVEIREDIINERRSKHCYKCWDLEKVGITSPREIGNQTHTNKDNHDLQSESSGSRITNSDVEYLDISLGNICNLKCRSCNPSCSHTWIKEATEIKDYGWPAITINHATQLASEPWFVSAFRENFYDPILPSVKVINFLGGEPLIVKEHYDWLAHIIECGWAKDIELRYNTNGTLVPNRILDIWKHFKKVTLSLSLDAVGPLAYYVRFPSEWSVILKNVQKLKQHCLIYNNLRIQIHTTVSMINVMGLADMIDWCVETKKSWQAAGLSNFETMIPHINVVTYPEYLSLRHMPENVKQESIKLIKSIIDRYRDHQMESWEIDKFNNIEGLINVINQPQIQEQWEKFIHLTKLSDNFRKVSIHDYIEWSKEYM